MSKENGTILQGGYRLQAIEIYNWGTFDQKIWKLTPNCKNSLLTGANGSGKTTLVDAIITLLVPPGKRHYNQSSGTTSKKERNEATYTLGAYVTVQSESGLAAKTQYLRTKDDFSILLGVFYNPSTKTYCSLAQVRWYSNNDLKKSYFIANTALSVEEHFIPLDTGGVWKKRLKKETGAEAFNSFTNYQQVFSKQFGLKSNKALTLFAQTVGIKVLGNLNAFIRTNMLEEHDSEAEFVELREHYENLLSAHQAIEKAREQALLLAPIVENGNAFHELDKEVDELNQLQESIAPYFAKKKITLLEDSLQSLQIDADKRNNQIVDIRQSLGQLVTQRTDLQVAVSTDQAYERTKTLAQQIQQTEREKEQRQQRAKRYNQLADLIDGKQDPAESVFYKALENSQKNIGLAEEQLQEYQQKEIDLQIKLSSLQKEFDGLQERLVALQKRKTRVPLAQLKIREAIINKLDLSENALPFAAELLKINEEEKDWMNPIEHALRPLAMTLLVKEEYFQEVLGYIHKGKLGDQIAFQEVKEIPADAPPVHKHSILQKVAVKQNSEFTSWLQYTLNNNYDYVIQKGPKELAKDQKSITQKGLIKTNQLHQRDDRYDASNTDWHILGWENKAAIFQLQKQLDTLQNDMQQYQDTLTVNKENSQKTTKLKDNLNRFSSFQQFGEIDWKSLVKNIQQYKAERDTLMGSSNQLQELKNQLSLLKESIDNKEADRDKLIEQRGTLLSRAENYQQQLQDAKDTLSQLRDLDITPLLPQLDQLVTNENLVVSSVAKIENRITKEVNQNRAEKAKELARVERRLTLAMQKFINPPVNILAKYPNWVADTVNFQADIKYLKEFEKLYKKIKLEDLPKYQKRFKDWLNERLIFDIANFKTSLENKEVQILESVEQINDSLKEIHYNSKPLTYIQLDINKTRDIAVREFKEMLKDAMPDPAKLIEGDEAELEKCFKRIKTIIEELSNNEPWRKKVTDVRNWLEFAAIERYRADDAQRQYYMDSQSLSGGEKAKLAYTILASAIAYQFGIRSANNQKKSFRFAVVDEAFSKVDPENSIYAMELFKQLNLQLMVVTPLDKINLAEPYIHAVHYVQNKEKKKSEVFDMPMSVYEAKKAAFRKEE